MFLHDILKVHKKTVLFGENGFNVKCCLKPDASSEGYDLNGFSTFVGCTFSKDGEAFFGDIFEVTINLDELFQYTDNVPQSGWCVSVYFPQINKSVDFSIENAPVDRTIGTCLLRCSALTAQEDTKRVSRRDFGGI